MRTVQWWTCNIKEWVHDNKRIGALVLLLLYLKDKHGAFLEPPPGQRPDQAQGGCKFLHACWCCVCELPTW